MYRLIVNLNFRFLGNGLCGELLLEFFDVVRLGSIQLNVEVSFAFFKEFGFFVLDGFSHFLDLLDFAFLNAYLS